MSVMMHASAAERVDLDPAKTDIIDLGDGQAAVLSVVRLPETTRSWAQLRNSIPPETFRAPTKLLGDKSITERIHGLYFWAHVVAKKYAAQYEKEVARVAKARGLEASFATDLLAREGSVDANFDAARVKIESLNGLIFLLEHSFPAAAKLSREEQNSIATAQTRP